MLPLIDCPWTRYVDRRSGTTDIPSFVPTRIQYSRSGKKMIVLWKGPYFSMQSRRIRLVLHEPMKLMNGLRMNAAQASSAGTKGVGSSTPRVGNDS